MDAVIGNIFHQRRVDSLLLLDPTHAVEHLTHSNNLKVAAIARDVDFLERVRSSARSEFHDFPWATFI
jgi:hypothetical protein